MADTPKNDQPKKDQKDHKNAAAKPTGDLEIRVLQEQLKEFEEKVAVVEEQMLRTAADFQNFRRRVEEERAQVITAARTTVILSLLPVIDNFDRAFKTEAPAEVASTNWYQGVQAIRQQFESFLKELGVERIVTVGQKFDPALHEAVTTEASDQPADEIIEEFDAGYRLGDDVIRHAKVKVSSGTASK